MKKLVVIICGLVFFMIGCRETKLIPYETGGRIKDPLVQDGLMGYKDQYGRVVIKAKYIFAEEFNQYGIAAVGDPKQGWIYIDKKGQFVIKPYPLDNGYDPFREGLARFEANGKIGYFNERGKIVIPAMFEYAFPFKNGYAAVVKQVRLVKNDEHYDIDGKWGVIDKTGKLIIPYRFDDIISCFDQNGVAEVVYQGRKVEIDTRGEVVMERK